MTTASRHLLSGVPRLHFYEGGPECPRDLCLPAVMTAIVQFLDLPTLRCSCTQSITPACTVPCAYTFFTGVSGVASYFSWKPGWFHDSLDVRFMAEDRIAPFGRAIHAAGFGFDCVGPANGHGESACRASICSSIEHGLPVIGIGPIIGPPEPLLITGYDDDGEVLIGWSFFQRMPAFSHGLQFAPTGEFRKRDWYAPSDQVFLILHELPEPPALQHACIEGLRWMLRVGRASNVHRDRHNGPAAYDAWTTELLCDEAFPPEQHLMRHEVHNAAVGWIAEARWYGSKFLVHASSPSQTHYRMSEHLLRAASAYAAEHALMWSLWDLAGGHGSPEAPHRFADPSVRRHMVPIIREARDRELEALDQIEAALEKLGMQAV